MRKSVHPQPQAVVTEKPKVAPAKKEMKDVCMIQPISSMQKHYLVGESFAKGSFGTIKFARGCDDDNNGILFALKRMEININSWSTAYCKEHGYLHHKSFPCPWLTVIFKGADDEGCKRLKLAEDELLAHFELTKLQVARRLGGNASPLAINEITFGVVPLIDVFGHIRATNDGQNKLYLYAVTPYFRDQTLSTYIAEKHEKGATDEREATAIVERLLQAVQFMHSHGFVHRDLKPANVLVRKQALARVDSSNGSPLYSSANLKSSTRGCIEESAASQAASRKSQLQEPPAIFLCDFGFCVKSEELKSYCGTLAYMAPEIIANRHFVGGLPEAKRTIESYKGSLDAFQLPEPVDGSIRLAYSEKVDTFSVGAISFEILTGKAPFKAPKTTLVALKILKGKYSWEWTKSLRSLRDSKANLPTVPEASLEMAPSAPPARRVDGDANANEGSTRHQDDREGGSRHDNSSINEIGLPDMSPTRLRQRSVAQFASGGFYEFAPRRPRVRSDDREDVSTQFAVMRSDKNEDVHGSPVRRRGRSFGAHQPNASGILPRLNDAASYRDLVDSLLATDERKRPTCSEALKHVIFTTRKRIEGQMNSSDATIIGECDNVEESD